MSASMQQPEGFNKALPYVIPGTQVQSVYLSQIKHDAVIILIHDRMALLSLPDKRHSTLELE